MINNYYSIPSIPCEERENIIPDSPEKQEKCQGLNPDSIYQTLYPSKGNPLSNFTVNLNTNNYFSQDDILDQSQLNQDGCALSCISNPQCNSFAHSKTDNICKLSSGNSTNFDQDSVNISGFSEYLSYRKNDLLEDSNSCNVNDNFITQPSGYMPDPSTIYNTYSKPNLGKEECLSSCANDNNCQTAIFGVGADSCVTSQSTSPSSTSGTKNDIYTKKNDLQQNRFGAPDNMSSYYLNYPKDGKIGDSFCEYVPSSDKCMTSYVVGPGGDKVPPKIKYNPKYVPPNKLCMPPNCIPELPNDGKINKLTINGEITLKCDPGDKKCQERIGRVPYFNTDFMGLPTASSEPNPSNGYLPYTSDFDTYKNYEIVTDQMDDKPEIGAMNFPEDCQKWCNDSIDCGAVTYSYGDDGRPQCRYYKNIGEVEMKSNLAVKDGSDAKIKRGQKIVQNPQKKFLDKPYFNQFNNDEINVKKQKACKTSSRTRPPQDDINLGDIGSGMKKPDIPIQEESDINTTSITNRKSNIKNIFEGFADNSDYQWQNLTQVAGGFSNISYDGSAVCGVTPNNQLYCADENIDSSPNWTQTNTPTQLKQVSLNQGRMYAVDNAGNIYYSSTYNNPNWNKMNGSLSQVDLNGNVVCGTNSNNDVYCANQNIDTNPNWFNVPGKKMKQVAIDNNNLIGIDTSNNLYFTNQYSNPQWGIVNGTFDQIDMNGGVLCGVNSSDNSIKCADQNIGANPNWTKIDGSINYVSVSNGKLYGLTPQNQAVYRGSYKPAPPQSQSSQQDSTPDEVVKEIDIPKPNYGICPDGTTLKKNTSGSNCPTPLMKCSETNYGCCPDGQTPKNNDEGTNCQSLSNEECIKSEYGCCPGTNIPKKYLCDCDKNGNMVEYKKKVPNNIDPKNLMQLFASGKQATESCSKDNNCNSAFDVGFNLFGQKMNIGATLKQNFDSNDMINSPDNPLINTYLKDKNQFNMCKTDFCKDNSNRRVTNCELNKYQIGDPYAFSSTGGQSCNSKNECGDDGDCINGFCRKINKRFYNGLNQENHVDINDRSGFSMNTVFCGNPKPDSLNKDCPDKYDPVCGMDGKTYKNDCQAENSGVDIKHYGTCDIIEGFNSQISYFHISLYILFFIILAISIFYLIKAKII